ncbi:MAG TPA: peptide chain release factor N(5)-glutamine methyltransferase [Candidatus Baltobacteraceae bacterium]
MTCGQALRSAAASLRASSPTPALDARLLLGNVTGRDAAWLLAHGDEPLEEARQTAFLASVARRVSGEPVAYLVGRAGFFGREFIVTPDVLIGRPETEHLIEAVLADITTRHGTPLRVADIGTGSGIIALTLAAELSHIEVFATDASQAALDVAQRNVDALGIAGRVRLLAGDLAAPLAPFAPFACVAANLPYVRSAEVPAAPHPVSFEPRLAIDGGPDGLVLYRRLMEQLPPLLAADASLFFEAAPDTIEALSALVEQAFPHAHVEVGEDYAGFERYVAATLS